jgi:hypothetical protein
MYFASTSTFCIHRFYFNVLHLSRLQRLSEVGTNFARKRSNAGSRSANECGCLPLHISKGKEKIMNIKKLTQVVLGALLLAFAAVGCNQSSTDSSQGTNSMNTNQTHGTNM